MFKKKRVLAALLLIFFACIGCSYLFFYGKDANSSTLNVYEKIAINKEINYLVIGDSIGRGAGVENRELTWFAQWEDLLKRTYGIDPDRNSIVQSGATAFEGLYLFKTAEKPVNIDLTILFFGENDRKYMDANEFAVFYEALIREIKSTYPNAEIITITESSLKDESIAETIKRISNHYHTNHIDMRIPFEKSGKTTAQLTADLTHPNSQGYRLYADALFSAIKTGIQTKKKAAAFPQPLTINTDMDLIEIQHIHKKKGHFVKFNDYYSTRIKGSSLSYSFSGSKLGVKVLKSEEGGEMDVFIDGQFVKRISTWWPIQKSRMIYITSNLPPGEHEVIFKMTGTKSVNNTKPHPIIQIASIIVSK